ncbi:tify domain-containing protein/CCT_2 domain-containing protein [Cephalotus follicularis]|uniref:Protein TIFY n=1 Tax=Cephalotus follicularis TaxID=3775 RepID=A0A1Q3C7J9_CEPFO|nr:tify domain-containing protein/CCT_2 domain-containing protein [Cephalotus follicularis]
MSMGSSSEFEDLVGHNAVKAPEKSSFNQKCSKLSQYLKEKGDFGDLSLGMTCNLEANGTPEMLRATAATMNLFPVTGNPGDVWSRNMAVPRNIKSMEFFPQCSDFLPSIHKEDVIKTLDKSEIKPSVSEPETAQMTIFYAGQVIVFNDFPAHKAKEVMLLASNGCSQSHVDYPSSSLAQNQATFGSNIVKNPVEPTSLIPVSSSILPNFGGNVIQEINQPTSRPIVCDLPIKRNASLHRFLEKRKDRIKARAPFQTTSPSATPSKPAEGKSWLGLAA